MTYFRWRYNKSLNIWAYEIYVRGDFKCCSRRFGTDMSDIGIETSEWIYTRGKHKYGNITYDATYEVCMTPV